MKLFHFVLSSVLLAGCLSGCPRFNSGSTSSPGSSISSERAANAAAFGIMGTGTALRWAVMFDEEAKLKVEQCLAFDILEDVTDPIALALLDFDDATPEVVVDWCACAERYDLEIFDGLPEGVVDAMAAEVEKFHRVYLSGSGSCRVSSWTSPLVEAVPVIASEVNEAIKGESCRVTVPAIVRDDCPEPVEVLIETEDAGE